MMNRQGPSTLLNALKGLRVSPATPLQPFHAAKIPCLAAARTFTSTAPQLGSWLEPFIDRTKKKMKGRPRVATGGSVKGTTIMIGDYGLRMVDHHRRISAAQLKLAEATIKQRLRGQRYRLYTRVNCNIGVYISGNEVRMGKGKGSFDHWAARVAVNRVIFEIRGALHEQVARDAFRLAGNKLPGQYEFIKKGEPAVVGITKLDGVTLEDLKRPRKQVPTVEAPNVAPAVATTPSTVPPTPPAP